MPIPVALLLTLLHCKYDYYTRTLFGSRTVAQWLNLSYWTSGLASKIRARVFNITIILQQILRRNGVVIKSYREKENYDIIMM